MNLREIYTILREKLVLKSIISELSFIKFLRYYYSFVKSGGR